MIHCEVSAHYPPLARFDQYMVGQWWRVVHLDVNNRIARLGSVQHGDEDHEHREHDER